MIKKIIRSLIFTIIILLIPFLGNIYVDGWNWPWTAFAFFGTILFGVSLAYEIKGKYTKKGVIVGFIFGEIFASGIIALLRYINPEEDIAGIVIATFLLSGIFFAFIGYLIQNYLKKYFKKNNP